MGAFALTARPTFPPKRDPRAAGLVLPDGSGFLAVPAFFTALLVLAISSPLFDQRS
jgi:hypothetical protein